MKNTKTGNLKITAANDRSSLACVYCRTIGDHARDCYTILIKEIENFKKQLSTSDLPSNSS